jgi:alginate O-acetyltransferase complex protein AlgI
MTSPNAPICCNFTSFRFILKLNSIMLFTSTSFLIFFVVVGTVYFALPSRLRSWVLLGASYYFYATYEPLYLILLAGLTLFNYYAGIRLGKAAGRTGQEWVLAASLVSCIGTLFFFKYLNLFAGTIQALTGQVHAGYRSPALTFLLPVGISFFTFKIMNYMIDVYRDRQAPETQLASFALYVSFFPQLIAGPIDRATKLLPQMHVEHAFDYRRVTDGLRLMLWGFFQKVVIADTLATLVDPVFDNPVQYQGARLTFAAICFTFQIYCDFAGYSDIAIGAAQVFGYTSMNNFDRPYFAKSIPEFWRRWHISLSTWFRDYLYIPLGGNRTTLPRWYLNLFLVFLISGLWHGSNWTFLVWGALHGFLYICSLATQSIRARFVTFMGLNRIPSLYKSFRVLFTFILVAFAWIFFRANTISDAFYIVSHLFTGWSSTPVQALSFPVAPFELVVAMGSIVILETAHLMQGHGSIREIMAQKPVWLRWGLYYGAIVAILLFGNFGSKQFIYFQF